MANQSPQPIIQNRTGRITPKAGQRTGESRLRYLISGLGKNRDHLLHALFIVCFLLASSGCTLTRSAISSLRSTDHFVPLETDKRVLYEPGAEAFAEQMAELLPQAIEQVEAGHYRPFVKPVTIHVCASQENYEKLTGIKAPASITLKGVFFSPRLVEEQRPLSLYLAHELSHLHLEQQIGKWKFARLPAWFKEGLATYVSGGGGAQNVTESEAVEAIKTGKHFEPNEKGSIFFRKYGHHWGLSPQMFYRQSMMFVAYLKDTGEEKYCSLLLGIQDGAGFSKSFHTAFDASLAEIWKEFLTEIEKSAGHKNNKYYTVSQRNSE